MFVYIGSIHDTGFESLYDMDVGFVGVVADEPDRKIDRLNIVVKPDRIFFDKTAVEVDRPYGYVLVRADRYEDYEYGDQIEVHCRLRRPLRSEDFDYRAYLSRYKIFATCSFPKISLRASSKTFSFAGILYFLKSSAINLININVHEPYSSFAAGILLGARQGVDPRLLEASNRVGVTHVIAVSGYNVAIVVTYIFHFLYFFGVRRQRAYPICLVGVFVFVILTGASASVVRAGIMGAVALSAVAFGRRSSGIFLLWLVAFFMVVFNPLIPYADVGFQLSFASTAGLILYSKSLEDRFYFLTDRFGLRSSVASTLSAMIFTTPLIIYQFGRVSLIAIFANVLIAPLIPLCMILAFSVCLMGIVGFGAIAGGVLSWVLILCVFIIESLSMVPYSSVEVSESLGLMMFFFMALFFIYKRYFGYIKLKYLNLKKYLARV